MTSEGFLGLAAATASFFDLDISRQARDAALAWRAEDVEFMNAQREWQEAARRFREKEMDFRREEILQRILINRRREIDEKNEQLKNIASISSLIAGFSVIVLINISIDLVDSPEWIISIFAATSAFTTCFMTYAFVMCTLILVGTLKKFEQHNSKLEEIKGIEDILGAQPDRKKIYENPDVIHFLETRFLVYWSAKCEEDWNRAYNAFTLGVPAFLLNMIFAGYLKFYPDASPAIVITVVCALTIVLLFISAHMKWGIFLQRASSNGDTELNGGGDPMIST